MPFAGAETIETLVTLPVLVVAIGNDLLFAGKVTLLELIDGGGASTVILILAGKELPPMPCALSIKLSSPTKFAIGV